MEILLLIIILSVIGFIIYRAKKTKLKHKSSGVKKSEIISDYRNRLDLLKTKEEKVAYLKIINQELSRNIFFDQNETEEIIRDFVKRIV